MGRAVRYRVGNATLGDLPIAGRGSSPRRALIPGDVRTLLAAADLVSLLELLSL